MQNQNIHQLGPLIAKYKDRQFSWSDLFSLFIPGFLAFSIPAVYALFLAYYAYTNYGKAAAISWIVPWLIISTVAFIIFIVLILYRISVSKRYIAIHNNGIYISLRKKYCLLWDQISGISSEIIQRKFLFLKSNLAFKAIIYTINRDKIKLNPNINHLSGFISRFKKIYYPIINPIIEQNLLKGKNIYFGKVSIDRDFFIVDHNKVQWSLINQVTIQNGRLIVELTDHNKIKIPTSKIQNIELLLALIKQGDNIIM
ncbi:MAG: hypothetical protein GYA34_17990 [Chloroflexi bacterium]|nr:hypothetical protein [Chloroflexota bacterium]